MQAMAKARFVRTSPRKARLVIDEIRGKDVKEALAILKFTPNRAARLIEKVINSAVANAENNFHMNGDSLKVAVAFVDGGPNVMKRVRSAPMGRMYRIVKRMSHITIAVEETEPKPEKKRGRKELARGVKPTAKSTRAPKAAPSVAEKPTEPKKHGKAAEPKEAPAPEPEVEQVQVSEVEVPQAETSEGETDAKGGE